MILPKHQVVLSTCEPYGDVAILFNHAPNIQSNLVSTTLVLYNTLDITIHFCATKF